VVAEENIIQRLQMRGFREQKKLAETCPKLSARRECELSEEEEQITNEAILSK
jgi:hypothetical protein